MKIYVHLSHILKTYRGHLGASGVNWGSYRGDFGVTRGHLDGGHLRVI